MTKYIFQVGLVAGRMLSEKLRKYKNMGGVVLGIPRAGIPVACLEEKEFDFPVETLIKKQA